MLFNKRSDEDADHDYAPYKDQRPLQPSVVAAPQPPPVKSSRKAGSTHSVIDTGLIITGNLQSEGEVLVEGQIHGDIRCAHLIVAQDAVVKGNITAEEVVVRGKVTGIIRAHRVQLMGTSHVESEIFHKSLAVEEGANFEGVSRRREDPMKDAEPLQAMAAEMKAANKGKSAA
jgi:cytoskeletal protein CcmA (bactofilin family)